MGIGYRRGGCPTGSRDGFRAGRRSWLHRRAITSIDHLLIQESGVSRSDSFV